MRVLVATDGHLDPKTVAEFCAPLTGPEGSATVLTVVEVPRTMLQELRGAFSDAQPPRLLRTDIETVTTQPPEPPRSWPGDDAIIDQYLESKLEDNCQPVVAQLQAAGILATGKVVEGPAVKGILDTAADVAADVIVIGSHGGGFFEGLLGSTSAKVTRLAKCPVLLLRH
jgi:nucleotide-binding universal stress UspA family protein